jgi:hypothetical protein
MIVLIVKLSLYGSFFGNMNLYDGFFGTLNLYDSLNCTLSLNGDFFGDP